MGKKILILDNDEPTVRTISHISRVCNVETLVIHNWGKSLNLVRDEEIMAVFLNVELGIVNIPSFLKHFPQEKGQGDTPYIPVYFLFKKLFSPNFQNAKKYPHAGDLKKPVKLEQLADIIGQLVDIDEAITYVENTYRRKWEEIRARFQKTEAFMERLESIIG